MKHFPFIVLLLGLLVLGGEGARASFFTNHLSQAVDIDIAGVGANPYSGPGTYSPNWFDENGDDVGWGYYVAVPPGGVVPLAIGATFSLYDPENGWAYLGGDDALVNDPNTFFQGNNWWHQGFIEGAMNLGSPDGTIQKARLLGAPSLWDSWNSSQEAEYGSWAPSASGDPNLAALLSALTQQPSVMVAMFMLGLVSAITAGIVFFGLWTFLHWFYLRLRGRDLA